MSSEVSGWFGLWRVGLRDGGMARCPAFPAWLPGSGERAAALAALRAVLRSATRHDIPGEDIATPSTTPWTRRVTTRSAGLSGRSIRAADV